MSPPAGELVLRAEHVVTPTGVRPADVVVRGDAPGRDADAVVLDADLSISGVLIRGEWAPSGVSEAR